MTDISPENTSVLSQGVEANVQNPSSSQTGFSEDYGVRPAPQNRKRTDASVLSQGVEANVQNPDKTRLSLYRKNVGIMIINPDKKVWIGLRGDADKYTDCATQMPQGGIDEGETPVEAAWREMYEEVGLTPKTAELIAETPEWFYYDFPDYVIQRMPTSPYIGQRQKWFLFQLTGTDDDINLHVCDYDEFSSFQWMSLEDVPNNVIDFKQEVYRQVCAYFKPIIDSL